ncbi:4-hydroxybenzoate polyprenyltransferase [Haloferax sp. MBLA0076]|uniref:4-hydroxybenzoate polyprenyltransferase n=1 Tax=Haloferax litoreum TaxID=2666140 RepID=A0A6A8GKQ5_9EURY|nr:MULTISPECIES: UbiA family prenyltransferase [Haloferax]KAB1190611.1 4-hydroxybenzoate polyprenyltransferase [Haloferax sp. CBA1148]MRX23606.1 4-hydroxybenzoate polyprenyltransferase [Haloferax litoreum]
MSSEPRRLSIYSDGADHQHSQFVSTLLTHLERTKDVLIHTSTYLVFIAMVQVATVMAALSIEPNPALLIIGLVTFAVYTGDRIADVDTDEVSNPEQSSFVRRHKSALSVLTAATYGLAIAISVLGGPVALGVTLIPGVFWVLYASDWLPTIGSYFKRLKEILVVNSVIVALAWAISLVFLPLAFADAAFTPVAAVIFFYYFLDTFVNTEIPNVNDVEADEAIGVSTLPVVFGVDRTRQIAYGLDIFLVGFVVFAYLRGLLGSILTLAILVGLGYALVLAAFVGRTDHESRLGIAGEAKHLVVMAVILALTAGGF